MHMAVLRGWVARGDTSEALVYSPEGPQTVLNSPPGAGSAPTSRLFDLIVGHDGIYGVPAVVYRATVCYPYSRQTFRHLLTSRDEPPRHWIPPGVNRGTEAWY